MSLANINPDMDFESINQMLCSYIGDDPRAARQVAIAIDELGVKANAILDGRSRGFRMHAKLNPAMQAVIEAVDLPWGVRYDAAQDALLPSA